MLPYEDSLRARKHSVAVRRRSIAWTPTIWLRKSDDEFFSSPLHPIHTHTTCMSFIVSFHTVPLARGAAMASGLGRPRGRQVATVRVTAVGRLRLLRGRDVAGPCKGQQRAGRRSGCDACIVCAPVRQLLGPVRPTASLFYLQLFVKDTSYLYVCWSLRAWWRSVSKRAERSDVDEMFQ